jgi:CRISPR/Cas system-associated endoribonuclease Cas2
MRIQYSVFSAVINAGRYDEMTQELQEIVERHPGLLESSDSVIATRLPHNTDMRCIIGKDPAVAKDYLVIG